MLYDTILCVVDSDQNRLTQDRVTEFVRLTGNAVHMIYLAPEHSIPGAPDAGTDVEIDEEHVRHLQEYLARAIAGGVEARGEIVPATHYGRSDAILERAQALKRTWSSSTPRLAGRRPRPSSPRRSWPATTRWRCSSRARPPFLSSQTRGELVSCSQAPGQANPCSTRRGRSDRPWMTRRR